ncbi:hypothetical protein [Cupriavidus basilensis]|uniref:hypothetical protein n=1 Tax=Cupriavidus basilensis TaxID=68895 RepID=UPI003F5B96A8
MAREQVSIAQERAKASEWKAPVAKKGRSQMKTRVRRRSPSTHMTATMPTEIERAYTIRWIRAQMLDYGLTMEELEASGCFAPPPSPRSVCYRNAGRLSWDGTGEMPDCPRRTVNAGQMAEHSRVRSCEKPAQRGLLQIDYVGELAIQQGEGRHA